ncbi:MAG: hypothetical protein LBK61_12005 [Spirochaetaceae bacterium]|jgi:hypothetical protein|nr:hypothetical protein [Spirochaetaceae bacterium]
MIIEQDDKLSKMMYAIDVGESAPPEYGREHRVQISLMDLYGSCEGEDTLDAYFERKRTDKTLEEKYYAPRRKEMNA